MRQTKGAIGNLLNRYKAVLKKCNLLNTFGSLAVASMLVMGGAGVAQADGTWTQADGTEGSWTAGTVLTGEDAFTLSGTYDGFTSTLNNTAGVAAISYDTPNVHVESGTTFRNNSMAAAEGAGGGALKILTGTTIGDNVTFEDNTASDGNGWGGGAIYIKLINGETPSEQDTVTIGTNAKFTGNTATNLGGAIALEYGKLNIAEGAIFSNNSTTSNVNGDGVGGGAIAVWHDYNDNGDPGNSLLTLDGAIFEENSTVSSGGAIYNSDGIISISNTTFKLNEAARGGAIYNEAGDGLDFQGSISINNSNFYQNESANGGALWQGALSKTTISGSRFIENSANTVKGLNQGGAITNAGEMTITDTLFQDNEAGGNGGAIANVTPSADSNSKLLLSNVTVEKNSAGTSGGGIYNASGNSIEFEGTNKITENTSGTGEAETNDDFYNAGTANVNSGTTTIGTLTNSGKVNVGGTGSAATLAVTESLTGSTDMTISSLGTLSVSSKMVLNGDTVNENLAANVEAGGTYRITDLEGDVTDKLLDLKKLLGTNSVGLLDLDDATIQLTYTEGGHGHVAYENIGNITNNDLKVATVDVTDEQAKNVQGGFAAVHIFDQNAATTAKEVATQGTLRLFGGSSIDDKLVSYGEEQSLGNLRIGDSTGASGNAEVILGDANAANKGTVGDVVFNAGDVEGNTATLSVVGNEQGAEFKIGNIRAANNDGTYSIKVNGATLHTGNISTATDVKALDTLSVDRGSVRTDGSAKVKDVILTDGSFTATATTTEDATTGGDITISGALSGQGEVIADKSLTFEKELKTGEGTNLFLTAGTEEYTGTVNFGGALDSTAGTVHIDADTLTVTGTTTLVEDSVRAGQWDPNGKISAKDSLVQIGQFGSGENTSSLDKSLDLNGTTLFVHGDTTPETLATAQAAVSTIRPEGATYYTNKTLNLAETTGTLAVGTVDLNTNTVAFGKDSLLVVDSNSLNGSEAFTYGTAPWTNTTTASVADGAKLHAVNVQHNQTVTIFGNGFNEVTGAWTDVTTDTPMLSASYNETDKTLSVKAEDAREIYPDLSDEMASLVNQYYIEGLNTTGKGAGSEFLRRATNRDQYLADDRKAAASTIESAARIAFAGAVPQMTKLASDAATNAVVNRLGFANPDNGAKAMNVDGKLVDDKALGLALWIAPLWSNQTGFGMEAGNLDYGYNANLGGISLGADYTWANNIRAGLMFNIGGGYAESAGGDLSETTNSMTFWGLGAYGGWEYNNFAVMADVSYTSTWNSVDQDVDHRMGMGDLEADIQASAISAGLRFEYKLETQYLDLIPHVGARYMSINTWGYDVDSSMGTILEGDGFQQNIWTFPVGITFSKELEMNNDWYFKPSVDFTVIPAAGDIKAKEDVRFNDVPISAELETQMMDYFTWQGGVGLEFGNDNMSVGVNYTLQAGQNSTGHGVFGMFRYEF